MGYPNYPTNTERYLLAARVISPRTGSSGGAAGVILADQFDSTGPQIQNGAETILMTLPPVIIPNDVNGVRVDVWFDIQNTSTILRASVLGDIFINGAASQPALLGEYFSMIMPPATTFTPAQMGSIWILHQAIGGPFTYSFRTVATTNVGVDVDGVTVPRLKMTVTTFNLP